MVVKNVLIIVHVGNADLNLIRVAATTRGFICQTINT